jgi:transcriptional regulator with PAS, ATPase and Fis domain
LGIEKLLFLYDHLDVFCLSEEIEYIFEKLIEINGEKVFLEIKLNKMLDISTKFCGTVVILNDITKRKKAEDTLRKSEREKKAVLRGIGEVGVFSDKIRDIFIEALKLHNDRDIPVLIQGETGTGKEIIARLIHYGYAESKEP